ncbi:hypothetical protein KP509_01G003700 [Ceratopteris richardii]|uniref:SOSEKI DIX-like domain-containing protein n=1 Tax=Ceratopteris richardii TaxID=49495 RepID=A0A8T2VHN3_CERRI|nr:hypothetical protein KP509_01G003700 [Ceratopteris richardii]KAH7445347.1 hypothetical protein KP509_01G003700 [Ceratopteris richardii]
MEVKSSVHSRPLRRKVHVVYYLSRVDQMDQPHLLEAYISGSQDGIPLRDFKKWLAILRGKSIPSSFSWSYKRAYKNGFIWHDLGENDLIFPLFKNEYVLMGSAKKERGINTGECTCGSDYQKRQPHNSGASDQEKLADDNHTQTCIGQSMRIQKLGTKSISHDAGDHTPVRVMSDVGSSAMSGLAANKNSFYDNMSRTVNKNGRHYRAGGLSRSFNGVTAQGLLEDVRSSLTHKDTIRLSRIECNRSVGCSFPAGRVMSLNSEATPTDKRVAHMQETRMMDVQQAQSHDVVKKENNKYKKDTLSVERAKYSAAASTLDVTRSNEHYLQRTRIDQDGDDFYSTYIMDASTQTGDSTRCSTEDQQDGANSESPNETSKFSPPNSACLNSTDGVSSERLSNIHDHAHSHNRRTHYQASKTFFNVSASDKPRVTPPPAEDANILTGHPNECLTDNTSFNNRLTSPGTLSSCSGVSARSSTRFAREEGDIIPIPPTSSESGNKNDSRVHNSGRNCKSLPYANSTRTRPAGISLSGAHALLKQILRCGKADATRGKRLPSITVNSNDTVVPGVQGIASCRRLRDTVGDDEGYDESSSVRSMPCKRGGLLKKLTSIAKSESDDRREARARASIESSIRDSRELIMSPDSMYSSSGDRQHLKDTVIKAHSLGTSSAAAGFRSSSSQLPRSAGMRATNGASSFSTQNAIDHSSCRKADLNEGDKRRF